MNASTVLILLLLLACPLGMAFMMRGGHGHAGHEHRHDDHDHADAHTPLMHERSTAGLRELRDEIDQMIEERERFGDDWSEDEVATGARR